MMRRLLQLAGVGVLVAALAGCVGIPTSGPVTTGQNVAEQDPDDVQFIPEAPSPGASQEEILRGFIAAFSGSASDYAVARQFLAPGLSGSWDPRASVLVRSTADRYVATAADSMTYSFTATATVDQSGAYTEADQTNSISLDYVFVEVDGEWRITEAPDGIVLSDGLFRSIFDKHALYFLDPTDQHLVPDLRWFPGGTSATRIATALLAGPPAWLQGAVRTAFPDGTSLSSSVVSVESGVALVDLSTEALAASDAERQLMRLQLAGSLVNVASISRVSLSVEGTVLSVPEQQADAPRPDPQVDARALIARDGAFGYYSGGEVAPIAGISGDLVTAAPRGATVDTSATQAAVLGAAGVSLIGAASPVPILVDARPGLIVPSLDDYGFVWSAVQAAPGSIRIIDAEQVETELATGFGADTTVESIDVSRDSARVAILLQTPTGPRLVVAAVVRDPDQAQRALSLGEPVLDVTLDSGAALDATWVDELTVAVLTDLGAQDAVTAFELGGERTSYGRVASSTQLVGGNGEVQLRTLSESGHVYVRRGSGWSDTGVEAAFLATQR